jgi:dipeptidyl aminopeptidase/acylaminoacyl peptidase
MQRTDMFLRLPARFASFRRVTALVVTLLAAVALVQAQAPPDGGRREGDLRASVDTETEDLRVMVDALRHRVDEADQRLIQLAFVQQYGDRVRTERVLYPNRAADLTPGYVFEPVRREEGKSFPGLVLVHGGYHSSLDAEFFPHIARLVADGYTVVFPEYRGSRGYGKAHYEAQDYGGKDVDDVLAAAEYLAGRPGVDGTRLGIVGISRGGMTALLAIEREPKRFRAAVDIVGLTDFVAYMSYKPDFRRRDVAKTPRFGGLPGENLPAYLEVSPINHVDKIETPLLILATTHDEIVPVQLHTQRLIDALKARGKPFESKIYERAPGGHGFYHGDTAEARDAAGRVSDFLRRHLKP